MLALALVALAALVFGQALADAVALALTPELADDGTTPTPIRRAIDGVEAAITAAFPPASTVWAQRAADLS